MVVRRGAVGGAEDIAERSLEVFSSGSGLIGFPGPRLVRRVGHVTVTWLACHAQQAGAASSDTGTRGNFFLVKCFFSSLRRVEYFFSRGPGASASGLRSCVASEELYGRPASGWRLALPADRALDLRIHL